LQGPAYLFPQGPFLFGTRGITILNILTVLQDKNWEDFKGLLVLKIGRTSSSSLGILSSLPKRKERKR